MCRTDLWAGAINVTDGHPTQSSGRLTKLHRDLLINYLTFELNPFLLKTDTGGHRFALNEAEINSGD